MISFRDISKTFHEGQSLAVKALSLEVSDGETLVLLGSSGSGKTTLLKMVNGLVRPTSGTVHVDREDTAQVDPVYALLPIVRNSLAGFETIAPSVTEEYRGRFDLEWLLPLGFDNSYTIAVRRDDASGRGWTTISDLARDATKLRAGFTAEFAERADGYRGLSIRYGFAFGEVRDLDPASMYSALAGNEVDAIAAFANDGRIEAYDLQTLGDDASYFPPYQAAPVARREVLERWPELRGALSALANRIDDATMRGLNASVDEAKRSIEAVAAEFLRERGRVR